MHAGYSTSATRATAYRDPITSGKLLICGRGILGDHRKHKENFEKYHFIPKSYFF
jgi:hypothetical protein